MTVLTADAPLAPIGGYANPNLASGLADTSMAPGAPPYLQADIGLTGVVPLTTTFPVSAAPRVLDVDHTISYSDDFYNRIHVIPAELDLGTISSQQTRTVTVWNSYLTGKTLASVDLTNASGIAVTGATSTAYNALQMFDYTVNIAIEGPPTINATILWNFSDAPDPYAVPVTGLRAVVLAAFPEVPVQETWSWLTDVAVSVDATEQRVGLRRVPRFKQELTVVVEDESKIRTYNKYLMTANGRLFLPFYQWASTLKADASAGSNTLFFDSSRADVRDGEYAVLVDNSGLGVLVQVATVTADGCSLVDPLTAAVVKGTTIAPAFACLIASNPQMSRPTVNTRGTLKLSGETLVPRTVFQRPLSTATLTTLDGYPILERVPTVEGDVDITFDSGQYVNDNQTGLAQVGTDWLFTRTAISVGYRVSRVVGTLGPFGTTGPQEMDYWRKFFDTVKGQLNPFLTPTYRGDLSVAAAVGPSANSMVFAGSDYFDLYYGLDTYKRLAIKTASGIQYVTVTACAKTAEGNTSINFTPNLPAGAGWQDVQVVSFLLKVRLASDKVKLSHYELDTVISFPIRTIPE